MAKLAEVNSLLAWLKAHGGFVHPATTVQDGETGLGVYATAPIAPNERLVSCPFDCAVTPGLARTAIKAIAGQDVQLTHNNAPWDERMLIAAYVGLHWVYAESGEGWPAALQHREYVLALPDFDELTTPLYYTAAERALLEGTNLAGAVGDREEEWRAELASIRAVLGEGMTWERYLAVQTFLSSRAFPSSLLSLEGETRTVEKETASSTPSHPVLLPGLDLLNHARNQPILWLSSKVKTESGDVPSISFVAPSAIQPNSQVLNNYGAKSNEALLLGYGFVIPDNPDDTVVLRLGGAPAGALATLKAKGLDPATRFAVGRDGVIPQQLLEILRVMVGQSFEGEEEEEEEDEDEHAAHEHEVEVLNSELDVLGMLGAMLESKLERLTAPLDVGEVRATVERDVDVYRRGQVDILNTAMDVLAERVERVERLLEDGPECPCGC